MDAKKLLVGAAILLTIAFIGAIIFFSVLIQGIFPKYVSSTPVTLVGSEERYLAKERMVLGGDGVRCWEFYGSDSSYLGRGCTEEVSGVDVPVEVWANEKQRAEDLVMVYKVASNELVRVTENCPLADTNSVIRLDRDLKLSFRVLKSFELRNYTQDSGNTTGLVLSGDVDWCTASNLPRSIKIERSKRFIHARVGEVKTPSQLEAYLQDSGQAFEVYDHEGQMFFIAPDTIHGTAGGSRNYVVWFVTGTGPIYRISFDQYVNVDSVKTFLNSVELLK